MKKRIIIGMLSLLVITVGVIVAKHYMNRSEDEETDSGGYSKWFSEVRYSPGSKYNYDVGGEVIIEAPYNHTFTMDTKVTDGGVTFNIYYYDNVYYNDKPNEELGDLIRSEHITETGVYTYNLNDLSDGHYWLEIKSDGKETIANVKYEFVQDRSN